jgi:hypothetical protein
MAMTAKVFSISGLSIELGRDRRTISRALSHTPPDGKCEDGTDGWHLRTALQRLGDGRDRYADDAGLNALEAASAAVDDLLDALRAEPSVKRRRELLKREGRAIGELTAALDRVRAGHSDSTRMVEGPFVDGIVGAVIAEVLALCDLKLEAA